jgi:hypothetical protein
MSNKKLVRFLNIYFLGKRMNKKKELDEDRYD